MNDVHSNMTLRRGSRYGRKSQRNKRSSSSDAQEKLMNFTLSDSEARPKRGIKRQKLNSWSRAENPQDKHTEQGTSIGKDDTSLQHVYRPERKQTGNSFSMGTEGPEARVQHVVRTEKQPPWEQRRETAHEKKGWELLSDGQPDLRLPDPSSQYSRGGFVPSLNQNYPNFQDDFHCSTKESTPRKGNSGISFIPATRENLPDMFDTYEKGNNETDIAIPRDTSKITNTARSFVQAGDSVKTDITPESCCLTNSTKLNHRVRDDKTATQGHIQTRDLERDVLPPNNITTGVGKDSDHQNQRGLCQSVHPLPTLGDSCLQEQSCSVMRVKCLVHSQQCCSQRATHHWSMPGFQFSCGNPVPQSANDPVLCNDTKLAASQYCDLASFPVESSTTHEDPSVAEIRVDRSTIKQQGWRSSDIKQDDCNACGDLECKVCNLSETGEGADSTDGFQSCDVCPLQCQLYWNRLSTSAGSAAADSRCQNALSAVNSAFLHLKEGVNELHRNCTEDLTVRCQDTRQEMLKMLYYQDVPMATLTKQFMERISDKISDRDLTLLSSRHAFDCLLILLCCRHYNSTCQRFRLLWTWSPSALTRGLKAFQTQLWSVAGMVSGLVLDQSEAALLSALALYRTDVAGLENRQTVEEVRASLLHSLHTYVSARDQWSTVRVRRLFSVMPDVQILSVWRSAILLHTRPTDTPVA
ncbi:hypothetical protein ACOMHN_066732 [Nucella lapillus]